MKALPLNRLWRRGKASVICISGREGDSIRGMDAMNIRLLYGLTIYHEIQIVDSTIVNFEIG